MLSRRCLSLVKYISTSSKASAPDLPYGYIDIGPRSNISAMSSLVRYMLPENKSRTTFLYQKISPNWIPQGYSNDPIDLEKIIDHNLELYYGAAFQDAKPVLVKIDDGMVAWHVLEAKGKYYMLHGRLRYLRHIEGPASWAALEKDGSLEGLRKELVYRKDGTL